MRGAGIVLAALATGCGGSSGTEASAAPSSDRGRVDSATPYPVIWSRTLPSDSAFEIAALHVDATTGDVVVAGTLRSDIWLVGASLAPRGISEGLVVRFDPADGSQLWVARISASKRATALAVGSDGGGNTLVVGEYRGQLADLSTPPRRLVVPYVGEIDQVTGDVVWMASFGPDAPNQFFGIGLQEWRAAKTATMNHLRTGATPKPIEVAKLVDRHWSPAALLPTGYLAITGAQDAGLFTFGLPGESRWERPDLKPMSMFIDASGNLVVAGRHVLEDQTDNADESAAEHVIASLAPHDGTTIWQVGVDVDSFDDPHLTITSAGHNLALIIGESAEGRESGARARPMPTTYVHRLSPSGGLLSRESIDVGSLTHGTLFAVRGPPDDRELVKLGPCPVERCSVEAR